MQDQTVIRRQRQPKQPPVLATVHRTKLQELLTAQDGKMMAIDFTKLDGTERMLNGRMQVRKHLAGGAPTLGFDGDPYAIVYDVQHKGYRAVNLATVKAVRAGNTRYAVIG